MTLYPAETKTSLVLRAHAVSLNHDQVTTAMGFIKAPAERSNPLAAVGESFQGQVILVTGANAGSGLEAAKRVAAVGPHELRLSISHFACCDVLYHPTQGDIAVRAFSSRNCKRSGPVWLIQAGGRMCHVTHGTAPSSAQHENYPTHQCQFCLS